MGLLDIERISMIRSAVFIQSTRVTDGRQADRQTDRIALAYTRIMPRVKKKEKELEKQNAEEI